MSRLRKLNNSVIILIFVVVILVLLIMFFSYRRLEEAGNASESKSASYWLDSGAYVYLQREKNIKSVQGELQSSKWHRIYKETNPSDTDNGEHPQNIFRLIYRSKKINFEQSAFFKINKINLSSSPNRNSSNGILFFSHYIDSDNLYYTGLRVDGKAIIKKKIKGEYITLAEEQLVDGEYNTVSSPNLLPEKQWIGIKSTTETLENSVDLKLYKYDNNLNKWELILQAKDLDNPILSSGFAGIRTDFLDFECRDYSVSNL